jgi:murein DD-endopeptidase MepM/ murein hydrolase activator NlpD
MNKSLSRLLIVLFLAACLSSACAVNGGYWVPPHATVTRPAIKLAALETSIPVIDLPVTVQETVAPTLEPPEPVATEPAGDPPPVATASSDQVNDTPILYYSQAADTLPVVAVRFGVKPAEISSPQPIPERDFINPGQLLIIPRRLANTTASNHLIPDSEVVYSPSAINFDISAFAKEGGGKLSSYNEWLKSTSTLTGAEVLKRVALENSINPRLLLALLEYQSHWVYGQPENQNQIDFPMGLVDLSNKGLYHQLVWAVNQLSIGYYAYREGRLTEIHFADGSSARLAPDLNAGTAALQYYFAQLYSGQAWVDALDPQGGFPALYERMFPNPWERAKTVEPLFPSGITQPSFTLPFARNWVWSFTGGPHGAWEHDGAYAALDFAPGSVESGCVKSLAWVTAAASGLVVRSGNGAVVIDLDGDGYEQTGWVLLYMHVSNTDRVVAGAFVDEGTPMGHPSCEGGVSTGTHLHIARKYNGEWVPADGPLPFNLGGWVAHAGDAAYKGYLSRGDVNVPACTCSSYETRVLRTDNDP